MKPDAAQGGSVRSMGSNAVGEGIFVTKYLSNFHIAQCLQGGFEQWLATAVGIRTPDALAPSVLCGLEAAVLMSLAKAEGRSISSILSPDASDAKTYRQAVAVNGLLDCQLGPEECATEALRVLEQSEGSLQGLKMKVRCTAIMVKWLHDL